MVLNSTLGKLEVLFKTTSEASEGFPHSLQWRMGTAFEDFASLPSSRPVTDCASANGQNGMGFLMYAEIHHTMWLDATPVHCFFLTFIFSTLLYNKQGPPSSY